MDGSFLCICVHAVQTRAASLFHQSSHAWTTQSLFKFLDKLEESPGKEGISRKQNSRTSSPRQCLCKRWDDRDLMYRCVFSTDCLMDQKLTSFHLEILTKSWKQGSAYTVVNVSDLASVWWCINEAVRVTGMVRGRSLFLPSAPSRWAAWAEWSWPGRTQRTDCSIYEGSTGDWTEALEGQFSSS